MPPCWTRRALVVVVGLAAMVLSAAVEAPEGSRDSGAAVGDAAFAVRSVRIDVSPARWSGEERRDGANADRALKHRLVGFAVLFWFPSAATLARGVAAAHDDARRPARSWWSSHAGRSPPALSSLIA